MLARILSIVGLVSAGLLLFILTTTIPATIGAFGILAVFVLTYTVTVACFTFALWILARLVNRIGHDAHVLRKKYVITVKKSYYYASVLALGPVILISLQSVGGVGVYELGLVAFFMLLGCVYVSRRVD